MSRYEEMHRYAAYSNKQLEELVGLVEIELANARHKLKRIKAEQGKRKAERYNEWQSRRDTHKVRNAEIVRLRETGVTYLAIGQQFGGLSKERVRQIIDKAERIERSRLRRLEKEVQNE